MDTRDSITWIFLAILFGTFTKAKGQHDPHFKENRSVIVHLFEWKFDDVAIECEQILGPRGYGGVQLSPVNENIIVSTENVSRPWWERYQPMSYKILTRSGDEDEFLNMSRRCNDVGVRIYVDVVFNHMAAPSAEMMGTADSTANGTELDYPGVPFTKAAFHRSCAIDKYTDAHVIRNCKLGELPDLNQSLDDVQGKIITYLNRLIKLGVAGFRVDAAKHMWPQDLQKIYGKLSNLSTDFDFPDNSRPFIFQEVIDLGGEPISKTEYNHMGVVTEFQACLQIGTVFNGNAPLTTLINWGPAMGFLPHRDALVFVDNHDNQRGHGAGGDMILTHKKPKSYRMATAFLLAHPFGIPRIMSSFSFNNTDQGPPADESGEILSPVISDDDDDEGCGGGWVCEHRWNTFINLVEFRRVSGNASLTNWQDNGANQIAFCRGDKAFIAFNADTKLDYEVNAFVCVDAGDYCDIISGRVLEDKSGCSGRVITVNENKTGKVIIPSNDEYGALAIHLESKLS